MSTEARAVNALETCERVAAAVILVSCATVPYEVPHCGVIWLPEEGGALLITDAG